MSKFKLIFKLNNMLKLCLFSYQTSLTQCKVGGGGGERETETERLSQLMDLRLFII